MWLCEAALVVMFGGILKMLPMKAASSAGGWLGRVVGTRLPFTRRAHDNLTKAFPDISEERKREIIRGMWNNLGRTAAESGHVHKLLPNDLARKVREIGRAEQLDAAKAGKPLVTVKALEGPASGTAGRLGFLEGMIAVPDDFDRMGHAEIERLFAPESR